MHQYDTIERFGKTSMQTPIYAFDKLDGSQIRAEWSKKRKFWKFGTRRQLISKSNKEWGEAVEIIKTKYERDLHDIFVKNRFLKVTCYMEFWGTNSFAGNHMYEPHDVTLFMSG